MIFSNPIFQRELRGAVRDRKVVLLVVAFIALLSLILLFLWPQTGVFSLASDSSMQIFSIFLMSNLALIILLVPALASPTITTERENASFALLFTSLLSASEIMLGKLCAALAMILLVVLISLPVSAVCALSGGIGPALLIKAYSVILIAAVTYGLISLAFSALCSRTFTALILSYLAVALLAGCTWLPYYLLGRVYSMKWLWHLLRSISPFDALYALLFPQRHQLTQLSEFAMTPLDRFYLYALALAVLLVLGLASFTVSQRFRWSKSAARGRYYVVWVAGGGGLIAFAAFGLLLLFAAQGFWLRHLPPLPASIFETYHVHLVGMAAIATVALLIFVRYVLAQPDPGTIYRWLSGILVGTLALVAAIEFSLHFKLQNDARAMAEWSSPLWIYAIGGLLDLVLVAGALAAWRKSRHADQKYVPQFADRKTTVKRRLSWPFYLIDPLHRQQAISLARNPVFVVEMRSKVFGRPSFIIYGTVSCIIASMVLLVLVSVQYASFLSQDVVRWVAVVFQLGIVATLAPAISSGSITDELSSRTFLMLRMTPLNAFTVVIGKLKAAFVYVSIFLISSLPVLFSLAYLDWNQSEVSIRTFWRVGVWVAILVLTTITFITAGLCASAFSKTTSSATALSYAFAAFICVVTFAAIIPGAFTPEIKNLILTLNPTVAALQVTSDEMFADLTPRLWVHHLVFLIGLSLFFIAATSWRVYYIFTRRT